MREANSFGRKSDSFVNVDIEIDENLKGVKWQEIGEIWEIYSQVELSYCEINNIYRERGGRGLDFNENPLVVKTT